MMIIEQRSCLCSISKIFAVDILLLIRLPRLRYIQKNAPIKDKPLISSRENYCFISLRPLEI